MKEFGRDSSPEIAVPWSDLLNDMREGYCIGDVVRDAGGQVVDLRFLMANRAFEALTGAAVTAIRGQLLSTLFPRSGQEPMRLFGVALASGVPLEFELNLADPIGWFNGMIRPVGPDRISILFFEFSEQRTRETALLRAEGRYQRLFTAIDEGFCIVEMIFRDGQPVDYRFLETNAAFERHTGLKDARGRTAREMVPNLEKHWFQTYGGVATTREPVRLTLPAQPMGGRTFDVFAFPVDDGAPEEVGILFIDISERIAMEEQRTLLSRELAHRLKNTLAVVQSIVSQTLRTAAHLDDARQALSLRIHALARAHETLLSGERDGGAVGDIIRGSIEIHDPDGRVSLIGPWVVVGPAAALALSMAVNELATNAVKYGALSNESGGVDAAWSVEETAAGAQLSIVWREYGGPPVRQPERQGFGSRLIRRGISGPDGRVDIAYDPGGVVCTISALLSDLQGSENTG